MNRTNNMMDKLCLFCLILILGYACNPKVQLPQRPDVSELTKKDTLNWLPLGPFGSPIPMAGKNSRSPHGTGRFMCVQIQSDKPDELLIGHATSGVFKSENGGLSWHQTMNTQFAAGVFKLLRFKTDTKHLLAATALDIGNSRQYGYGLIESFDNGNTWVKNNLQFEPAEYNLEQTRDVAFTDLKREKSLIAITNHTVYSSNNAGQSWQAGFKTEAELKRIHVSPYDSKLIFLTGNSVFVSKDGGYTFSDITNWIAAAFGVKNHKHAAYNLDFSLRNKDEVFVVVENQSVFLLKANINDLNKFELLSSGFTYMNPKRLEIATAYDDLKKIETVWVGSTRLVKSVDGGKTFVEAAVPNNAAANHMHDDINQILIDGDKIWVCTDGGVDVSEDQGLNWKSVTDQSANLNGALVFGFDKSKDNTIMAGTQDNGIIVLKNGVWSCLDMYGDGGRVVSISDSNEFSAGFAQLNYKITNGGKRYALNHAGAEKTGHDFRLQYVTSSGTLYIANMHLYKKPNGKYFEILSSGLESDRKIKAFWVNPNDENEIWLAKDDPTWGATPEKKLYHTMDAGKTWTDLSKTLPILKWRSITDIAIGSKGEIAVTFEAFDKSNESLNKVYFSYDKGRTFVNQSDGLPNLPVNCIVQVSDKWLCGNNDGVYILNKNKWTSFGNGFPKTIVTEIKFFKEDNLLIASTFGRGLWSITVR